VGVLWMAFPLSMFPLAERHVSSALAGMLSGAVPLFVAIVAAGIARRGRRGASRWGSQSAWPGVC
jgi:drug/metabolite transporter (DMT)-like permease